MTQLNPKGGTPTLLITPTLTHHVDFLDTTLRDIRNMAFPEDHATHVTSPFDGPLPVEVV